MRYHVKERVFTVKDDFIVLNDKGEIIIDVKGSFLHFGDLLHIYSRSTGEELMSIKEELFTHQKQYVFAQNGAEIATMRHKGEPDFALNFFEVACANGTVLELRGDFKEWDFEIMDQYRRLYGHISKEFSVMRDHYTVDVPDGVDPIFVIAVTVTLDEMREDHVKTL